MKRSTKLLLTLAIALGVSLGGLALFTDAEAKGPCRCPQIYAPVECSNGKVYPNQCIADCRRAKDCTPVGDI